MSPASGNSPCVPSLAIRDVELAAALDRPEVVLRRDGPLVQASPSHLWAAPLRSELPQVLAAALQANGAQVFGYPLRFGQQPAVVLSISLDGLHASQDQAILEMRWQAWSPGSTTKPAVRLATHSLRITQALQASTASATVEAYSSLVQQAAQRLLQQLAAEPAGAAACGR